MHFDSAVSLAYLQYHFQGKYSCEAVVEVRKDLVPLAIFRHWILSCERNAAQDDDNHYECIEERVRDDAVDEYANTICRRQYEH